MTFHPRSQPHRLGPSIEDMDTALPRIINDSDEMFQQLYEDLEALDDKVDENAASVAGSLASVSGAASRGPQGIDGPEGEDGTSTMTPACALTIPIPTLGSILFGGPSGAIAQDNANFFWDDTNNGLGIGTAAPQNYGANYRTLEIRGNTASTGGVIQSVSSDASVKNRLFVDSTAGFIGTSTAHDLFVQAGGSTVATFKNGGNFGVGITNPSTKFVVSNGGAEGLEVSPTGGNVIFFNFNRNTSAYSPCFWDAFSVRFRTGTSPADAMIIEENKRVGIGTTGPTATLHLKAGTTAASTAPLKLNSGTVMTSPEAGAVEFTTDDFFATITTGAARKGFVLDNGSRLTSGKIPIATTNGRLIDLTASSAYTPTNVTTDRAYDANATTLDEVADVLGTLIADLQSKNILG